MRRGLLLPLLLGLAIGGAPASANAAWLAELSAAAPPKAVSSGALFLVTGHGWGHGVGMSQYGALGYAQHGWSYQKIVGHYFPGTTLGAAPVSRVRVLLRSSAARVTISSAGAFTIKDGAGHTFQLAAGSVPLGPQLKVKVSGKPKAKARALTGPLTFTAAQPLALDGRHYRGALQVDVVGGRLRVINVVGLENYLYGVVPSEMPFSWSAEALKAQAVVARSYALATRKSGAFDLYPDTRSQMYLGVDHERPSTNAAVDATAGQVVLYGGQVATTYFFSTSGGRTASPVDAWGGAARAVPYLVSVPDPYDAISPYHDWGPVAYGGAKLGRALHAHGTVLDAQTTLNGSGRVATLTLVTQHGDVSIPGPNVRTLLGLRSTWFTIGVLALKAPGAPVVYGSTTQLTGTARGVGKVELQQRAAHGEWQTLENVVPKAGAVAVAVRPTSPTDYRLATRTAAAGLVHVRVAPRVRIGEAAPGVLRGVVRPALAKAPAQVQRLDGPTWTTVAKTAVDSAGRFEAHLQLVDGMYRVRVAPGHGFAVGTSPPLKVVNG